MRITLYGNPVTKKNSQRVIRVRGHPVILPSKAYVEYEKSCVEQIARTIQMDPITEMVNIRCLYYMETRRRVDLVNLLEATCDILVKAGVIEDDNCRIVAGLDGSAVLYDKTSPRAEIEILRKNA